MAANDCTTTITACSLVDISKVIVENDIYGINCGVADICTIAHYYYDHNLDDGDEIDDNQEEVDDGTGGIILDGQFDINVEFGVGNSYVCQIGDYHEYTVRFTNPAGSGYVCKVEDNSPTTTTTTTIPCMLNVIILDNPTTTTTTSTTTTSTTSTSTTSTTTTSTTTSTTSTTLGEDEYAVCGIAGLSFSPAPTSGIGYLSSGAIVSGNGIAIGNYLVEWRLGSTTGEIVLTTDNTFFPFTNEPVPGGTLYPTINYIYLDGLKYSPYRQQGVRHSVDLLTCLAPIVITSMTCSNGGSGLYSHRVAYDNIKQSSDLATRIIKYDISSTTTAFAWYFYGDMIADRITITQVSGASRTTLKDWVIGVDNAGNNYTSTPKIKDYLELKGLITITALDGDYLEIKVIPSYNQLPGFSNTRWTFSGKCFTTFDYVFAANDVNIIDPATYSMVYDIPNCKYVFTYNNTVAGPVSISALDLYKYMVIGLSGNTNWTLPMTIDFSRSESGTLDGGRGQDVVAYTNETFTITKTGSTVLFEFVDGDDYNNYKDGYALAIANGKWTNYSADPLDINHYKFIIERQIVELVIGDNAPELTLVIGYGAQWTWDDNAYTITIVLAPEVNEYVDVPCSNVHETIDLYVDAINRFYNLPDFTTVTTKIAHPLPFINYCVANSIGGSLTGESRSMVSIPNSYIDGEFSLPSPDWHLVGDIWYFYRSYIKVVITDENDPVNNYEVYTKLDTDGSVLANWLKIYP